MIDDADAEPPVQEAAAAQGNGKAGSSAVAADGTAGPGATEPSEGVGSQSQSGSQSTWPGVKRVQAADAEGDKTAPAQTEAPKKRRIMPTLVSESA